VPLFSIHIILITTFVYMNNNLKIEVTADGSHTILIEELNEHYHSVKGALTESQHIYRDCAFLHRAKQPFNTRLNLLEIGFGTGLNAVVTAMTANAEAPVHYITLEKYPLSVDFIKQLNYNECIDRQLFEAIHSADWNTPIAITPFFTIEKRQCDYIVDTLPSNIDVVYFDAFAPEKQPDMWSTKCFDKLVNSMNDNAVLTTYCAKGEIRRTLQSSGLIVERLAGPVGGKREILRATKHQHTNQ